MNKLQVYKNEMFEVTIQLDNGDILFDVETVAKSLGFTQTKGDKLYTRWETVNKYLNKYVSQEVGKGDFIPESLVYKLAFKASNETAEKFQDWLAIEVLPSIRKHGAYLTPEKIEEVLTDPDTIIRLATNLKEEQQRRLQAERQLELNKPKIVFAEALEISQNSILVGELAKLLARNGIEDMGQNRLFKWLRNKGYLHKSGEQYNLPTQYSIELGLIETKTTTMNNPDGSVRVTKTPKITGKGQIYFVNKFKGKEIA